MNGLLFFVGVCAAYTIIIFSIMKMSTIAATRMDQLRRKRAKKEGKLLEFKRRA